MHDFQKPIAKGECARERESNKEGIEMIKVRKEEKERERD